MPTYEYRCKECGHELEVNQGFHDDPLTDCPSCGGATLRKRFGVPGITFKGGGFYKTDSRGSGSSSSSGTSTSTSSDSGSGTSTGTGSGDGSSSSKTASTSSGSGDSAGSSSASKAGSAA